MQYWINKTKILLVLFTILISASCGKSPTGLPQLNGIQGPQFNLVDGRILMSLKFLNLEVDNGFKAPIPETKNSFFEYSPNLEDGGTLLVFHLDIEDLRTIDIGAGDGNYLPDGRPVPGIPGGKLENSLRIDTAWKDISYFYHKKLFGVWIPFGFETAGLSGYWNMYFNQKNIGMLGLVGNDPVNNFKAGGIIFLKLQNLENPELKKLLQLSHKHQF
jgi:hypothetical protein